MCRFPPDRWKQARDTAAILGDEVWSEHALRGRHQADGARRQHAELILEKTWRPQLAVTAMDGYPLPDNGGNVLLPYSTAKLSLRLPPTWTRKRRARP